MLRISKKMLNFSWNISYVFLRVSNSHDFCCTCKKFEEFKKKRHEIFYIHEERFFITKTPVTSVSKKQLQYMKIFVKISKFESRKKWA